MAKTNDFYFDLVQKNPIFRFFGTFNRPKTLKPVPQKIATLFFGLKTTSLQPFVLWLKLEATECKY